MLRNALDELGFPLFCISRHLALQSVEMQSLPSTTVLVMIPWAQAAASRIASYIRTSIGRRKKRTPHSTFIHNETRFTSRIYMHGSKRKGARFREQINADYNLAK